MCIFISLSSGIFPSIRNVCQQNTVIAISSMNREIHSFSSKFFYNNFFFFSVSSSRRHFCYLIFFKINCFYVFFVLFIVLRDFEVFRCTKKKKRVKLRTIFPVYVSLSIRSASLKDKITFKNCVWRANKCTIN